MRMIYLNAYIIDNFIISSIYIIDYFIISGIFQTTQSYGSWPDDKYSHFFPTTNRNDNWHTYLYY